MHDHEQSLTAVIDTIREVSGIAGLDPDLDFYDAGVSSVQALPILLELETRFAVSIPDEQFIAARSPRRLHEMILEIKKASA